MPSHVVCAFISLLKAGFVPVSLKWQLCGKLHGKTNLVLREFVAHHHHHHLIIIMIIFVKRSPQGKVNVKETLLSGHTGGALAVTQAPPELGLKPFQLHTLHSTRSHQVSLPPYQLVPSFPIAESQVS